MGFLDNVGAVIAQKSGEVAGKTRDAMDVASLKGKVAGLNREVQEAYGKLGLLYYEAHKDSIDGDAFAQNLMTIKGIQDEIMDCNKKIADIGNQGKLFCTQCGAKLVPGTQFCTECGAKVGG